MIMMRFRPIAPKPLPPTAAPASSESGDFHAKSAPPGGRSSRRKCTNRRKRKSCSRDRTTENASQGYHDHQDLMKAAVTLPLLPEAPDLSPTSKHAHNDPIWHRFNNDSLVVGDTYNQTHCGVVVPDRTALMTPRQQGVVGSYVIVEGITDTWTDNQVMMKRNLEEDRCPGLITDVWNRVWWTNEEYRRMVVGDTYQDKKMTVWLMMKEKVPDTLQAFTCRVRVQRGYEGNETKGSALTLPCDVWRINSSGWFAWRLDVNAALSLGR